MDIIKAHKFLSGTISPSDKKEFETWLKSSKQNEDEFARLQTFWNDLGGAYSVPEADVEKAWEKVRKLTIDEEEEIEKPNRRINPWFLLRVASVVILIVSIGVMIYSRYERTYISTDKITEITLSDGSVVFLNTDSKLKIDRNFKKKYRKVFLEGEAFFNVTKDAEHPFKVFSGNTITEVLGTSFNVRCQGQEVRVTLLTGEVAFYNGEDIEHKMFLYPGQHGVYNGATSLFQKDSLSGMNDIAWKTKRLEFNQTPMSELCSELSTYYRKKIVFEGTKNYQGSFTGVINNISLDETIDIIELTMGMKANHYEDSIVFSLRNDETIAPR